MKTAADHHRAADCAGGEPDRSGNGWLHGWVRPGPRPPGGIEPGPGETLDRICGHWRIFQYRGGHRYSLDDLLTAWYGTSACPRAERIADLGSGIGSVALAAAWRCPGARVCTVEAQAESVRLARKSAAYNGLDGRFRLEEGDLRDPGLFADEGPFDLVLGSPPYWAPGTHTEAAHPQTHPARFELRGGVEDYAGAAGRLLAPGGVFACVFAREGIPRVEAAFRGAGLLPLRRREVRFREGEPMGICVFAAGRQADYPSELSRGGRFPVVEPRLTVRDRRGAFTPGMALVRLSLGFPPGPVGSGEPGGKPCDGG
ncbi:MAG: methyltransferase [Acidobacteria bacterium]|nr:methyltransferase [Acidobacteriota bacterium]